MQNHMARDAVSPVTVEVFTRTDRPSWLPQRPVRTGRTDGWSLQGCWCHGRGGPGMSMLCGCDLCLLQLCCTCCVPAVCCYSAACFGPRSRHKLSSMCGCCPGPLHGLRFEPKNENDLTCKRGADGMSGATCCTLHRIC